MGRMYKKIVCLLLLALLLMGADAGSKADPLVSKGWVDQYMDKQVADLEKRLEGVAEDLDSLLVVRLCMGRNYMEQNGEQVELEAAPYVTAAGRSYVPLRALGEAIGAEFEWDNTAKRVTYEREGKKLEMRVGSAYIVVDGVTSAIDAPPELVNNRVFVPIRVISENLGFAVNWLAAEKTAVITFGE